ncbi:MAG: hypothetical protein IT318_21215 [Anaerolineales bacterium]|nr:hypothetical protein [Anaerolineales bacterium]
MERLTRELPSLYGDHHVTAARAVLLTLPGLTRVCASAAWLLVWVEHDPDQVTAEAVRQALAERGDTTGRQNLPPVSARTSDLTDLAVGPGAAEQFVEHVPAWNSPDAPCPGLEDGSQMRSTRLLTASCVKEISHAQETHRGRALDRSGFAANPHPS